MVRYLAVLVLAFSCAPQDTDDIRGAIRFVDGDSVIVDGKSVRLHGIDAVEKKQTCNRSDGAEWTCGIWITDQANALWKDRYATCKVETMDRYGRYVSKCFVEEKDIGADLVKRGFATAYRQYSLDYVDQETAARRASRGLWSGDFVPPAEFRDAKNSTGPNGCHIKGNITESGRVYHMPGQNFYRATRISAAKGERWFCSEAEAKAAGWRASRS